MCFMAQNRIQILPKYENTYKANLHCHTTCSDGQFSPEEIKKAYKGKGYQIVAYSDHEVMVPHNELADEDFLPLTATEISVNKVGTESPSTQTYHINIVAKDKNRTTYPHQNEGPYERGYEIESINRLVADCFDDGFLCQVNHPRWSMQDSNAIVGLRGIFALEVFNYGCELEKFNGEADYEYELLIRAGGACGVTASDDNHNEFWQFGGWTMISAPSLSYDDVMKSLEDGDFYATNGPEIKEMYVEDGKLHLKTSPVAHIGIFTEGRISPVKHSFDGSDDFTYEVFTLDFPHEYIRVVIIDEKGKKAWTRAYFDI